MIHFCSFRFVTEIGMEHQDRLKNHDYVPSFLLTKIRKSDSSVNTERVNSIQSIASESDYGESSKNSESQIIRKLLASNLNLNQKEKLSTSYLLGDYESVQHSLPRQSSSPKNSSHTLPPSLTKALVNLKRHGHKQR